MKPVKGINLIKETVDFSQVVDFNPGSETVKLCKMRHTSFYGASLRCSSQLLQFFYKTLHQQKIDLLEAHMPLHTTLQCKHNFYSTGKPKNSWLALLRYSLVWYWLHCPLEPDLQYLRSMPVFCYLSKEVWLSSSQCYDSKTL